MKAPTAKAASSGTGAPGRAIDDPLRLAQAARIMRLALARSRAEPAAPPAELAAQD